MANLIVVGAGMGGLVAAIAGAEAGMRVTLLEKGPKVGGACAYSGGQVWVPANHVAAREGLEDNQGAAFDYVQAAAHRDTASLVPEMARRWLGAAAEAAEWLESQGAITWDIIPDYPDYYYPSLPGGRPTGRYLTARFDGRRLGADLERLHVSPHFPVGISYPEMFAWGGMSSKTEWDWSLLEARRAEHALSFGTGIAGSLFKAALDRGVAVLTQTRVVELLTEEGRVTGVRCEGPLGEMIFDGSVILATGSHDWSEEYAARFTGIPPADGGSVTPPTVEGDAITLLAPLGGVAQALPPWAAPVLPGYKLAEPAFPGDTGYRACWEHGLPHCFFVNVRGERFCDDAFHPPIVRGVLQPGADGKPANLPFFMIWDEQHHRKYGLGRVMPGGEYPAGLVTSAASLEELGSKLGIDGAALARTGARFSEHARRGEDPEHQRGNNLSGQRFRGDRNHKPHPNIGTVDEAPFFGMRMRLLNTGIAAGGVQADADARPMRADGSVIEGVYLAGEASSRAAAGVGYNSGYSLSRAMAFGYVAARHAAGVTQ